MIGSPLLTEASDGGIRLPHEHDDVVIQKRHQHRPAELDSITPAPTT